MKEIAIEAISRKDAGKGVARKMRAAQKIPAVAYGRGDQPIPLELNYEHFHTVYQSTHGENVLVNLSIDGKPSEKKALIREIQHDPLQGDILHIDFQYISMDQKINIKVPVNLIGTPVGVKDFGGILQWIIRELEISTFPDKIPSTIDVDISGLNLNDSIHIEDLGITDLDILDDIRRTIVNVLPPTVVKEATTEEGEGEEGEEGAEAAEPAADDEQKEPEVISEKKAEERQAKKDKE